ncbi:hypothetical protein F2P81_025303 [Scophthalmus maximus]|uniref:Uncharacterized protein n=1 Tax=Scophthalmus maximus TaxID=52904 RepID=A0A6A4RQ64_SCOMX|nr:hypothetical protein F2P81_025303 [Scophthalmus maximus]
MASSETPPPSTRQGVGIVPSDSDSAVPEVLLAVGEQVSPLSAPSKQITVSGVPPFIPNELQESELRRQRSDDAAAGDSGAEAEARVAPLKPGRWSAPSTLIRLGIPPLLRPQRSLPLVTVSCLCLVCFFPLTSL